MKEEEFIEMAETIVPAMTSLPEQSTRIRDFLDSLHEKKPDIAKGLMTASLICKAVGAVFPPIMIVGLILGGVSSALDPGAAYAGITKELKNINERLTDLEKKTDKILNILENMALRSGMKKIRTQFKLMLGYTNLELWAKEFHGNINQFSQNLSDFEKENMTAIFKDIYENKCDENLNELTDIYEYVMTARLLYFQITTSHYTHFVDINKDDREEMLMKEISLFSRDMINIADSMTDVCPFFHAYVAMPEDFQFYPVFIPEFDLTIKPKVVYLRLHEDDNQEEKVMWSHPGKEYALLSCGLSKESQLFCGFVATKFKKAFGSYSILPGPVRMITQETTFIGQGNGFVWFGGRMEVDYDSNLIVYRKYDGNGFKIHDSTHYFVDYKWSKCIQSEKVSAMSQMPQVDMKKALKGEYSSALARHINDLPDFGHPGIRLGKKMIAYFVERERKSK